MSRVKKSKSFQLDLGKLKFYQHTQKDAQSIHPFSQCQSRVMCPFFQFAQYQLFNRFTQYQPFNQWYQKLFHQCQFYQLHQFQLCHPVQDSKAQTKADMVETLYQVKEFRFSQCNPFQFNHFQVKADMAEM
jgi:surface antigen